MDRPVVTSGITLQSASSESAEVNVKASTTMNQKPKAPEKTLIPPQISSIKWGEMSIESLGTVKDVKLWPGGGRTWDWGETGTRHSPGIGIAECEELLSHGATIVVLSRGMERKLGVPDTTVSALRARGVTVHVAETKEAVQLYNELAKTEKVAGLFHSTC
jgi:hypothetical protein